MAGWLFYLFIVMMIVPFGGSAQYNIARNVGFVSCGIRAINHQMIIAKVITAINLQMIIAKEIIVTNHQTMIAKETIATLQNQVTNHVQEKNAMTMISLLQHHHINLSISMSIKRQHLLIYQHGHVGQVGQKQVVLLKK